MEHVKIIFFYLIIPRTALMLQLTILNEILSKHHWVATCEYKVKYSREMKTQHKSNGMGSSWNVEDTQENDCEDRAKESRERD